MKRPVMMTDIARQADTEIAGHLTATALKRLIARTERLLADPVYLAKHRAKAAFRNEKGSANFI